MERGNHELRSVAASGSCEQPLATASKEMEISILQPQGTELWKEQEMDPPLKLLERNAVSATP